MTEDELNDCRMLVDEMLDATGGRAYLEFFGPEGRTGYQVVYSLATTRYGERWAMGFLPYPVDVFLGSACRWYFHRIRRWDYGWELEGWSARIEGKETRLTIRPIDDEALNTEMNEVLGALSDDFVAHQIECLRNLADIHQVL